MIIVFINNLNNIKYHAMALIEPDNALSKFLRRGMLPQLSQMMQFPSLSPNIIV